MTDQEDSNNAEKDEGEAHLCTALPLTMPGKHILVSIPVHCSKLQFYNQIHEYLRFFFIKKISQGRVKKKSGIFH